MKIIKKITDGYDHECDETFCNNKALYEFYWGSTMQYICIDCGLDILKSFKDRWEEPQEIKSTFSKDDDKFVLELKGDQDTLDFLEVYFQETDDKRIYTKKENSALKIEFHKPMYSELWEQRLTLQLIKRNGSCDRCGGKIYDVGNWWELKDHNINVKPWFCPKCEAEEIHKIRKKLELIHK